MKQLLTIFLLAFSFKLLAQTLVFDRDHYEIIRENAAMRIISEMGYQESLNGIRKTTDAINLNVSSLALVETIILQSLSQVNEGLKDAIQVKQIGSALQRIYALSNESMDIASQNPVLLLFAETYIQQAKKRSLNLVAEVSGFILQEGNNILLNANVRDELLGKISMELQLINSYALAVRNAMFWANINGIHKMLNPYQKYINRDLGLVNQILIMKKIALK